MAARARVVIVLAVTAMAALMLGVRGGAATLGAEWSLFGRADAASFAPGTVALTPGTGAEGYEIVGFGAAGPSAGLSSFTYGGADAPAAHGGPVPAIVACDATFTATSMTIGVTGAYPYAGCVFFLGVTNTGDVPIRVDLGSLDSSAQVTCNVPGCAKADIDIVAGGPDLATISALCRSAGGTAEHVSGSAFAVPAGAAFVCPLFVTVLQSALEGTIYVVTITPPPLEQPQPTPTPTTGTLLIQESTPPAQGPPPFDGPRPRSTVVVPVATATELVAGARTPGALSTPLAPATGSGSLVQHGAGDEGAGLPGLAVLAGAAGALLLLFSMDRRR